MTRKFDLMMESDWARFELLAPGAPDLVRRSDRWLVLLPFGSAMAMLRIDDAAPRRVRLLAGSATLLEPGTRVELRHEEPVELLAVAIEVERVARLAGQWVGDRPWRIEQVTNLADGGVAAIGQELRRSMLTDHIGLPAYLQALADALATRLLCDALGELGRRAPNDAMAPAKAARVLRHIDEKLDGPIRVADLAAMAGLSRWHFSRVFQRMTGETPQRYVLARRVCRARDLLADPKASLAEVALRSGFSSQAHMTTVFRQEIGTTPRRYRAACTSGEDQRAERG